MDSNRTILRNLEEYFNISGADAFGQLAKIPQYLLEDQLILASAHLFVKNIASIYMRWLFLQPFSYLEGHPVVGSFAPFMKVRGLSINEVLEMWKQESKAALKLAHGDSEREVRMKMRVNRLRREIESEYFKWDNVAKKDPEVLSSGRQDSSVLQKWPTKHIEFESIEVFEPLDQIKSQGSGSHVLRTMRLRTICPTLKGLMSKSLRHLKKHNNGEDPEREQPEAQDDSVETQDNLAEIQDDLVAKSSAKLPKEVIDLVTPTLSESRTSTPIPHPSRRCRLSKRRLPTQLF